MRTYLFEAGSIPKNEVKETNKICIESQKHTPIERQHFVGHDHLLPLNAASNEPGQIPTEMKDQHGVFTTQTHTYKGTIENIATGCVLGERRGEKRRLVLARWTRRDTLHEVEGKP